MPGGRQTRLRAQEDESAWAGLGVMTGRQDRPGGLGPREAGNESLCLPRRRGSGPSWLQPLPGPEAPKEVPSLSL